MSPLTPSSFYIAVLLLSVLMNCVAIMRDPYFSGFLLCVLSNVVFTYLTLFSLSGEMKRENLGTSEHQKLLQAAAGESHNAPSKPSQISPFQPVSVGDNSSIGETQESSQCDAREIDTALPTSIQASRLKSVSVGMGSSEQVERQKADCRSPRNKKIAGERFNVRCERFSAPVPTSHLFLPRSLSISVDPLTAGKERRTQKSSMRTKNAGNVTTGSEMAQCVADLKRRRVFSLNENEQEKTEVSPRCSIEISVDDLPNDIIPPSVHSEDSVGSLVPKSLPSRRGQIFNTNGEEYYAGGRYKARSRLLRKWWKKKDIEIERRYGLNSDDILSHQGPGMVRYKRPKRGVLKAFGNIFSRFAR